MTLTIVRGAPGSGKSTYARTMCPGVLLVENDMFHMHDGKYCWSKDAMPDAIAWCISMAKTALENDMDVVVANTFTKRSFIAGYEQLARDFGAKFKVVRCIGHFNNVHGLDAKMVSRFEKSMEDWPGEVVYVPAQSE